MLSLLLLLLWLMLLLNIVFYVSTSCMYWEDSIHLDRGDSIRLDRKDYPCGKSVHVQDNLLVLKKVDFLIFLLKGFTKGLLGITD